MAVAEQIEQPVAGAFGHDRPAVAPDQRQAMVQALALAARRGELSLHFQPQVDLRNGAMYGVEALLRWSSPVFGAVPPSEFIPLAEQHELMVEIGDWVLRRACGQAAAWRRGGVGPLRVSVNVSAHQLAKGGLAQRVQEALLDAGAPPHLLGIEVTETMLALDSARAARELHALRAIGVQISLDDFGTGYSNLSLLRTLPIDVIKIDRSYVDDVTAAPNQVSITRAVIRMAHSLQMKVLAEGVETEGQLALLVSGGCDAMQGHCFSPALEAGGIETLWRTRPVFEAACLQRGGPRQRTLLLVDDEENILASLRRLLRRDGYRILTANSAAEGLLQLAAHEVDVIVSDQRMPQMTGVEFLRRAKALYPDTVRIVLSGYTELESITAAINEGAIYKFLTKPWEDQLLRANIDEAFRQKAMADDNRRLARQLHEANEELGGLNERLTQALATEHERTHLVETGMGSAVDMLLNLPAALVCIDEFGLISFLNHAAQTLWPDRPALFGQDAAAALPTGLAPMLDAREDCTLMLVLDGTTCHCRLRVLNSGQACGRLLLIVPMTAIEGGADE